ncbi:hypothetical protein OBBRIDRAFT_739919 [Obba rivulosa]|uniref:Zn(2)-C6 fungal-type domain-containing protein n=1 Tax=Obba rivulosa TaxID=1052685 RepID=A0A8E2AL94_9APHY|nr:hypothetical protein OBBRIDRAFT_739919 [Obba rivulosa]
MASTEKEPVKKKPIMACLFCRERKIACGPALPDNPDQRCNQCARRSLQCIYPKESRRGQHKRGPRAAKVRALLEGASGSGSELGTKTAASASSGSPCAGSSSYTGPSSPTVSPVPKPRAGKERERSASSTRAPRNPQLAAARRAVYRQQRKLVVQAREGELCGADAAGTPSASSTSSM